ncbi:hypothetical protein Dimus_013546 [Dionaea muscipula]
MEIQWSGVVLLCLAILGDFGIEGDEDTAIDQTEEEDACALDQTEVLPHADLSDELQHFHASQVAQQLRLPPDDLVQAIHGQPDVVTVPSSNCPAILEFGQPSEAVHSRAENSLRNQQSTMMEGQSSAPVHRREDNPARFDQDPPAPVHSRAENNNRRPVDDFLMKKVEK